MLVYVKAKIIENMQNNYEKNYLFHWDHQIYGGVRSPLHQKRLVLLAISYLASSWKTEQVRNFNDFERYKNCIFFISLKRRGPGGWGGGDVTPPNPRAGAPGPGGGVTLVHH